MSCLQQCKQYDYLVPWWKCSQKWGKADWEQAALMTLFETCPRLHSCVVLAGEREEWVEMQHCCLCWGLLGASALPPLAMEELGLTPPMWEDRVGSGMPCWEGLREHSWNKLFKRFLGNPLHVQRDSHLSLPSLWACPPMTGASGARVWAQ